MAGSAAFNEAAVKVKQLKAEPGSTELLKVYAYYKQVTAGPVDPKTAPSWSSWSFEAKKKYEARYEIIDMSAEEAEAEYIKLVNELVARIGLR